MNDVEQTAGDWADAKDGVSICFPVFSGIGSCYRPGCLLAVLLLANGRRSSLAAQFGEKRFFLQRIAGPQQFQEWILRVGRIAAGLA